MPTRRVSAIDGMAVTADVWEEAHRQHRSLLRLHSLLNHGEGIVTGLEVIASDPPDSSIYILPGIASDPLGQTVVMPEPRAYDLGQGEGLFYLILTYDESRPRYATDRSGEDAPLFVFAEYGVEAVTALPATAHVELARVRRHGQGSTITPAKDPAHPRRNELDLRFRKEIGVGSSTVSALAVVYLGAVSGTQHGLGLSNLARSLRMGAGHSVWVDRNVPIDYDLTPYTMVNLVAQESFQLTTDEMTTLYNYVQGGGTLLIESCRRDVRNENPPATPHSVTCSHRLASSWSRCRWATICFRSRTCLLKRRMAMRLWLAPNFWQGKA
ncbi:MAG: hypothetical protein HC802_21130 [Caldilineaceae bacterium]|nr:hypothetical protein [Caldilineaceae bacterium]